MQNRADEFTENCVNVSESLLRSLHLLINDSNSYNLKSVLSLKHLQRLSVDIGQVKGEQEGNNIALIRDISAQLSLIAETCDICKMCYICKHKEIC